MAGKISELQVFHVDFQELFISVLFFLRLGAFSFLTHLCLSLSTSVDSVYQCQHVQPFTIVLFDSKGY